MMIIDPVTLGDVACTRASVKYVFDRTGTLVQVPANTLAVTYDLSDLTKAPYALVEAAATKCLPSNDDLASWSVYVAASAWVSVDAISDPQFGTVFRITKTAGNPGDRAGISLSAVAGLSGSVYTTGCYVRRGTSTTTGYAPYVDANASPSGLISASAPVNASLPVGQWAHLTAQGSGIAAGTTLSGSGAVYIWVDSNVGDYIDVKLPEVEVGEALTSQCVVAAGQAPYVRSADVIASGAGLVYSNVAITETAYSSSATYALNAIVYDPATYQQYQSLIASNTGKALTDTTSWTPLLTKVNRWQMFDQYNNTQTSNPEEIIVVLSPQAVAQGVYIGNADASDVNRPGFRGGRLV